MWCVSKKEYDFSQFKTNIIYEYDAAIKNGQAHQWSLKIKIHVIYL